MTAGRHRIRVENSGNAWITVTRYVFTGCKVLDRPDVLVSGMKTPGLAILWLQNRDSSWYHHARDRVGQVDPFTLTVTGLPDGPCQIEWWRTWRAAPERVEPADVEQGRLALTVVGLETDVALKITAPP